MTRSDPDSVLQNTQNYGNRNATIHPRPIGFCVFCDFCVRHQSASSKKKISSTDFPNTCAIFKAKTVEGT